MCSSSPERTNTHSYPVSTSCAPPSRLLHDHAAREVAGQVPEFVLQHLLGMAPALVLPEQVHADALHHDREQQRADQHP